jgi:hypothetical protein
MIEEITQNIIEIKNKMISMESIGAPSLKSNNTIWCSL